MTTGDTLSNIPECRGAQLDHSEKAENISKDVYFILFNNTTLFFVLLLLPGEHILAIREYALNKLNYVIYHYSLRV